MTFDESIIYKQSLPQEKLNDGIKMWPYVVPALLEDKTTYTNHIYRNNYTVKDEEAIAFSSNGDFSIRWIGYYPMPTVLVFKDEHDIS